MEKRLQDLIEELEHIEELKMCEVMTEEEYQEDKARVKNEIAYINWKLDMQKEEKEDPAQYNLFDIIDKNLQEKEQTMEYNLINGDALEVLKSIKDGSIDCIITDPPYNISKKNGFKGYLGFKTGLDFGDWDKGFDVSGWIREAIKKVKKGGNIAIFTDWKKISYVITELEENGAIIKDLIRWEKTNPVPKNRDRRFVSDCEYCIWAVKKGGKWTFNRQDKKFERPLIKYRSISKTDHKEGYHPTMKPIYIMEYLVKVLTNENDIVLDCFMGSGSTGIAAVNLKRKFIGIELDLNYYEIAKKRIKYNQG